MKRAYRIGVLGEPSNSIDGRAAFGVVSERVMDILVDKEGYIEIVSMLPYCGVYKSAYDVAVKFGLATAGFFWKRRDDNTILFSTDKKFVVGTSHLDSAKAFSEYCDELIVINQNHHSDTVTEFMVRMEKRVRKFRVSCTKPVPEEV